MKQLDYKTFIFMAIFGMGCLYAQEKQEGKTLVLNPYKNVFWDKAEHHKANFHTHTTVSDGWLNPHEVVDEYCSRDYTILALTDHHKATYPWTNFDNLDPSSLSKRRYEDGQISSLDFENRRPEKMGMTAVAGNEIVIAAHGSSTPHDCLSLFSDFEVGDAPLDTALERLGEYSEKAIAVIPHPAKEWQRQFGRKPGMAIPLSAPLRKITQGDFTIEAWFRATDNSRNVLIGNYDSETPGVFKLKIQTWINEVNFYMKPTGNGGKLDMYLSADEIETDVRDKQWHHLAAVRRDDIVYIYLDGKKLGQQQDTAGNFDLQGEVLYIGRDGRTGPTLFNGEIDDLRLWKRALSTEEISALVSGYSSAKNVARNALLAEYLFETSESVSVSQTSSKQVDDTANHPEGPFHIPSKGDGFYIDKIPEPLRSSDGDAYAISFNFPQLTEVPEAAVDYYLDFYKNSQHLVGIEITNEHYYLRKYKLDRKLWDKLLGKLMPNRPVWGFANDDMHSMGMLGSCWSIFPMTKPNEKKVRKAILEGAYYFSTITVYSDKPDINRTPVIESITHNEQTGTITVAATENNSPLSEEAYVWISQGQTINTGSELNYRNTDSIQNYARLEITGTGGTTFTNPFGFK